MNRKLRDWFRQLKRSLEKKLLEKKAAEAASSSTTQPSS